VAVERRARRCADGRTAEPEAAAPPVVQAAPPPPVEPIRAALPAKKRKPDDFGATASPAAAARLDAVVSQIVELAGRASTVLSRAEELARRAEQMLADAEDAAVRAEAGAMRAELAASRIELDMATGSIDSDRSSEDEDPESGAGEDQSDMFAAVRERLRVGSEQLNMTASATSWSDGAAAAEQPPVEEEVAAAPAASAVEASAAAAPSRTPQGIVSDFGSPDAGAIVRSDDTRRSFYRSGGYNSVDALAHSLVSGHDSDIPRVSPYIIQPFVAPADNGVQSAEAA